MNSFIVTFLFSILLACNLSRLRFMISFTPHTEQRFPFALTSTRWYFCYIKYLSVRELVTAILIWELPNSWLSLDISHQSNSTATKAKSAKHRPQVYKQGDFGHRYGFRIENDRSVFPMDMAFIAFSMDQVITGPSTFFTCSLFLSFLFLSFFFILALYLFFLYLSLSVSLL